MTGKSFCTIALVTLALVGGSAQFALADPMYHDSNTGLPMTIYNAPLCELQAQGLPISEFAQNYMRNRPGMCDYLQARPGMRAHARGTLPTSARGRQSGRVANTR